MRELLASGAVGVAVGLVTGSLFFGGLWVTVQRGVEARLAPLWFFVSLLVRLGLALAVFAWIGRDQPVRLAGALLGFIVARSLVLRMTRTMPLARATGDTGEERHGP